ncbi:MAG: CBS domain-containing protein [Deltaproteobacteria bacterium]
MATVSQLLATKGQTVHAIGRMATVFEAIEKMVAQNVGALLVIEDGVIEGGGKGRLGGIRPCGMLTERDYLRKVALQGRASRTTLVHEIMTNRLISVHLDTAIEGCMELMTRNRIRHLPVLDGAELAGLVSIGDIVKYLAHDRQAQIEQLTAYIQGGEMAHA